MKPDKSNWKLLQPDAPRTNSALPSLTPSATGILPLAVIARLGERRKGILAGFGILKGTGVFPDDSLEYQLEVRAEWD
ncbi:hypothetical protein GJ699_20690 [Duganella sp. FT80W]|uniref:Uncharacterized protein n=1 Tax=Duganella guangzhouensis TaxID=2666084 RepID=A0A6I2L808_9BURK|nr:hypothetical protein [Duganella guangzhouensis]MRW92419.1 hypothetical protein [Duganella guangzhouensis]